VIDEDGIAYISDSDLSVNGTTLEIVTETFEEMGIPVNYARLNERLVARSSEIIALGVGLGCCRIITIDGVQIGGMSAIVANKCQAILAQHYSNINNWTDLCENPGQKV
jgi:branched-subunit amino acid aminotransferase/4-amino-4-deoxychorismate lyase